MIICANGEKDTKEPNGSQEGNEYFVVLVQEKEKFGDEKNSRSFCFVVCLPTLHKVG